MRKERSNIQLGSFGNERIWWISQVTRDISFCVAHLSTSKCRVFGIPVTSSHRNDNCASQAWIWSISWRLLHCTHWLLWVCREKDFQEQYLWAGHASHILQRGLVLASHIQSHLRHQQTINKLWTPHEDRHQSVLLEGSKSCIWGRRFIVLTTKEIIIMDLDLVGGSEHYSVSSHPPMLVLIYVPEDCVSQILCKRTHP